MVKVDVGMAAVMAGMFTLSAVVSKLAGTSPDQLQRQIDPAASSIGLGIRAMMLLLGGGTGTAFMLSLRLHPINRMNRKLQAKGYAAAIAIGERALGKSQKRPVRLDLARAYLGHGQAERVRASYDELAAVEGTPGFFTEEGYRQAIDTLAEKLRQSNE